MSIWQAIALMVVCSIPGWMAVALFELAHKEASGEYFLFARRTKDSTTNEEAK